MARPVPILNAQLVPMFLAQVRAAGKDVGALIQKYRLPADVEALPEIDIPLAQFRQLAEDAADAAHLPALGVRTALGAPRGRYGLFEFLARSSSTVGDAMRALVEYGTVIHTIARYSLEISGEEAVLAIRFPDDPQGWGRHGNEYTLVLFAELVRQLSGKAFAPSRVWMNNRAPKQLRELESALGGAQLEFGAKDLGMLFDSQILAWPIVSADQPLHGVLEAQARRAKKEAPSPDDFVDRVRAAIRAVLETGHSAIGDVARRLHLGERTLQRRLEESGSGWSEVLDETRLAQARVLLARDLPLSEVAFKLGYSDVRAFNRAFQRWTGMSPTRYRQRQRPP